ncbi:MAG: hypothetical protein HYR84_04530 [Planctomycetes bacterium]|nr:hypothetical protein [Planctomycetota bacterium]
MSSDPSQQNQGSMNPADAAQIDAARRQINQLADEIAQLSEADIAPQQYYSEFLQRLYFAAQSFAGAIWIRTPQGNLQLQCQINLREVGLENSPDAKPMHDELLRQAAIQGKGGVIGPRFSHNFGGEGDQVAGNSSDLVILLAPVMQEKQVLGLIELWIDPHRDPNTIKGLYQFLVRMAAYISLYLRNYQLRQMLGQQDLWLKLEAFARQIHASLDTTEVAYLIANEARRLIEVDRISVATRPGDGCEVTAISGADVVEKQSNLVTLMRELFDAVIEWGERLVYTGTKDDSLPPTVLAALDHYLAESNSKILVVMPLHDERDKDRGIPARSALMMECFETTLAPEQLLARLDVVGRHAGPALYNAQEYYRIPMRLLWMPLAYIQDGLGGKAKAITAAVLAGLTMLVLAMIFIPFPLKMEATGQALPKDRAWVFAPLSGTVMEIPAGLASGSKVTKGQPLMILFDLELAKEISRLQTEIDVLGNKINTPAAKPQEPGAPNTGFDAVNIEEAKITRRKAIENLKRIKDRTNADLSRPGFFTVVSPKSGIILSSDFRDTLLGKNVKPGDPLIRVGATNAAQPNVHEWEIELKIPQKHVGQVLRAFDKLKPGEELDIDVMFLSHTTTCYRARLSKEKIAAQANAQKDEHNENEAVVMAWARISGAGIPADWQITPTQLLSGSEVHTRIRCGNRAMGYSLFYGVYEFTYEKVIFPYFHW